MPVVITTGTILLGAQALDTASGGLLSEGVKAVYGKAVGDGFAMVAKRSFELVTEANAKKAENHDLLKALRKSMLDATGMVCKAMIANNTEVEFAKKVQQWAAEQAKQKQLDAIEKWSNWDNAAEGRTEFMFSTQEEYRMQKVELVGQMAADWLHYLGYQMGYGAAPTEHQQQEQSDMPAAFTNAMLNGIAYKGKTLLWTDAVMVTFSELLRDEKNQLGKRANLAFNQNFLAELKLGQEEHAKAVAENLAAVKEMEQMLADIHTKVLQAYPDHSYILEVQVEALLVQENTIAAQQKTIDEQAGTMASQQGTISDLTKQLIRKDEKIERLEVELVQAKVKLEKVQTKQDETNEEVAADALNLRIETLEQEINEKRTELEAFLRSHPDAFPQRLTELEATKTLEEQVAALDDEELLAEQAEVKAKAHRENLTTLRAEKRHQLAGQLEEQIRYADALVNYRKAVELQPNNPLYLNDLGYFLSMMALHSEAIDCLQMALSFLTDSDKHQRIKGTILNNLGAAWDSRGEYDMAIEYYLQGLEVDRKVLGAEHPNIATRLNNLGEAWRAKGEYTKAVKYFEQAIRINRNKLGEEDSTVAVGLNNLGAIWRAKGEYDKAIVCYEQAVKIYRKTLGKNHPRLSTTLNNIGGVYLSKENYDEAIVYIEQALKIDQIIFGEGHTKIAKRLNNLAVAFIGKGKYDKAIENNEKALNLLRHVYGNQHTEVATILNNLGKVWEAKGEYNKATEYYNQALEIGRKLFGENHPTVAIRLSNLGTLCFEKEDYHTAKSYFEKAEKIFRKFHGEEHPHTKATKNWLQITRLALAAQQGNSDTASDTEA